MPEKYLVVGLMSGTSLDGLDIACVELSFQNGHWTYNLLEAMAIDYPNEWQLKLASAIDLDDKELRGLDLAYGRWLGYHVKKFIGRHKLAIDFVASHGHTVFHEPAKGITRQIGDGQAIADNSGRTTINDFRRLDVERGGQGAPLVPIGDKLLFAEYLACLNLGGIANISFEKNGQRLAFDIGMGNMPLNHFARGLGVEFDRDGAIASQGSLSEDLLSALNKLPYFASVPPKSLGVEWFIQEMLPLINSYDLTPEDKLATLVHHEAYQIGKVISTLEQPGEILVTGGGAYNTQFIKSIRSNIKQDQYLVLPEKQLIDFKEALIFALIGVLRIRQEINCLKSVTGAQSDSSSGQVFYPRVN